MAFSRRLFIAIITLICTAAVASADIKITTKMTVSGHSTQSTTLIKGARQRSELAAGIVTIYQCDLKRMIQINDNAKTYMITSTETEPASAPGGRPESPSSAQPAKTRRGGIVTFTITTTDTGERKKMFGFNARHIKTSMTREATPEACDPRGMRIDTDGWYIDLEYGLHCSSEKPVIPPMPGRPGKPECQDEIRYKHVGGGKPGYPLEVTTTIYGEDGKQFTTSTEIVDLSTAELDASLFDVPAGYTEAKNFQELMGVPSIASMAGGRKPREEPRPEPVAIAGTKSPGGIRVGVVPLNNKTASQVSVDSLRQHLVGSIAGSNVDAIPLDSSGFPADVEAEARQKQCDFILYTDITDVKKPSTASKIGSMIGRRSGAGSLKENYEARVDFRLFAVGNQTAQLTANSSAKEEGTEDVAVSAALDREGKAVLDNVKRSK